MSNYLFIGASRNIGLLTVKTILTNDPSATCSLLLRTPLKVLAENPSLQSYIDSGNLRITEGDATSQESIAAVWAEAEKDNGEIDTVLYSVGSSGVVGVSLTQGFLISPTDVCASTITPLLQHMHHLSLTGTPLPRLIAISSSGITLSLYKRLPLWQKPLYGWGLQQPSADKLALEYLIFHASGMNWASNDPVPKGASQSVVESISPGGWLRDVIIVRSALLTDSKTDDSHETYRASTNFPKLPGTISRTAVSRFIVNECFVKDSKWVRNTPVVGW